MSRLMKTAQAAGPVPVGPFDFSKYGHKDRAVLLRLSDIEGHYWKIGQANGGYRLALIRRSPRQIVMNKQLPSHFTENERSEFGGLLQRLATHLVLKEGMLIETVGHHFRLRTA